MNRQQRRAFAKLQRRQMALDKNMAMDPPVSEAQRRAMYAAASGKSTLGIPKKVGEEFVGKAKDEVKHDPKSGQFTSGGGESGAVRNSRQPTKTQVGKAAAEQHATWKASSPDKIPKNEYGKRMTKTQFVAHTLKNLTAKDERIKGAGIMLVTPEGKALFLLRGPEANHPNEWDLPGGKADDNETPEQTAKRETVEEIGALPYGDLTQIGDTESDDDSGSKVDFITYLLPVKFQFTPKVDASEHSAYRWADLNDPPEPLHLGVRQVVDAYLKTKSSESKSKSESVAQDAALVAFDRESVRTIDHDGRMHVALTHISKANVCPYWGSEIPECEQLGLDPKKQYRLYRDPKELKAAVATANNIPLLNEHIPVATDDHKPDNIVGATGTDAVFNDPYLDNSLVVWTKDAIDGIESGKQQEISCAYYYKADMTPGAAPDGSPYDGVMRDIKFNHVALVPKGRAGPDVIVGDEAIKATPSRKVIGDSLTIGGNTMSKTLSKKAIMAKGALLAVLPSLLAADAAINLDLVLADVKSKNWKTKKPGILAAIKPVLAKDANIGELVELLDKLDSAEPTEPVEDGGDNCEKVLAMLRGKIPDEELAEIEQLMRAEPAPTGQATDEPEPITAPPVKKEDDGPEPAPTKAAMDAAIAAASGKAAKEAEQRTVDRMNAIAEAREVVAPFVGKIAIACDSAESVYRAALGMLNVDVKGVHGSALKHVLLAQPKPNKQQAIAQDSSANSEIFDSLPCLARQV